MALDVARTGMLWQRLLHPPPAPAPAPEGVCIGREANGRPVVIETPTRERASAISVFGQTASGKSVSLATLVRGEQSVAISRARPLPATVLLSPGKPDLIELCVGSLVSIPGAIARMRYINPFERERPGFPFNLRHMHHPDITVDEWALFLAGVSSVVTTGFGAAAHLAQGARQTEILGLLHGAIFTSSHPAAAPTWVEDALLLGPRGIKGLASLTSEPRYREALDGLWLGEELRASCLSRARLLYAANRTIEAMCSASSCLDLETLIEPGSITLIDLSNPPSGNALLVRYWSALFARLLFERLMARPSVREGPLVTLVADEAPVIAEVLADCLERGLAQGRSKGLRLVVASQTMAQLETRSTGLLSSLLTSQVQHCVTGRLPPPEAALLSRQQAPAPGSPESASSLRERLTGLISNLPPRTFVRLHTGGHEQFVSELADVDGWERAVIAHEAELTQMKRQFWLPENLPPRVRLSEVLPPPRTRRRSGSRGRGGPGGDGPPPTPGGEPPPPEFRPSSRWG